MITQSKLSGRPCQWRFIRQYISTALMFPKLEGYRLVRCLKIKFRKANNPSDVWTQPDLRNNRSDPYFLPDGHNLEAGTNCFLLQPWTLRCDPLNKNLIQACLSNKIWAECYLVYFGLYFNNFHCWLQNYWRYRRIGKNLPTWFLSIFFHSRKPSGCLWTLLVRFSVE